MATFRMPSLPSMSKAGAIHGCACGCGLPTRRTWYPGHDGRATGWAIRIEKGIIKMDDVPENERAGARIMLLKRAEELAALAHDVKGGSQKVG